MVHATTTTTTMSFCRFSRNNHEHWERSNKKTEEKRMKDLRKINLTEYRLMFVPSVNTFIDNKKKNTNVDWLVCTLTQRLIIASSTWDKYIHLDILTIDYWSLMNHHRVRKWNAAPFQLISTDAIDIVHKTTTNIFHYIRVHVQAI